MRRKSHLSLRKFDHLQKHWHGKMWWSSKAALYKEIRARKGATIYYPASSAWQPLQHQVSHFVPLLSTYFQILEHDVPQKFFSPTALSLTKFLWRFLRYPCWAPPSWEVSYVAGHKMFGLLLLPMLVLGDLPCQPRDFGHSSHVCVCNRSVCLSV